MMPVTMASINIMDMGMKMDILSLAFPIFSFNCLTPLLWFLNLDSLKNPKAVNRNYLMIAI
jgi:hypothetical protein